MENKFIQDLANGQKYELELLNHIPYKTYEQAEGVFYDWDIKIYKKNGTKSTYEVKSDRLINKTGNICIEYMCYNKLSGISKSKAKYWAIFELKDDLYTLYKIPRKILIEYIQNKKYKRVVRGGDYNASQLYLFDKNLFKDYIIFSNI